jgi:glycosyltransferase involved in cell wall biosynthesis
VTSASVIVPNYNYGLYLPTCLTSVLGQTGVDIRVVVIDNASTDDSLDILRRLAARDSRIEIKAHEKNVGLISSLSEGVRWAIERGADLTMTLSADDVLTPGAIERASRVFEAAPSVGLVFGKVVRLPGSSRPPWSKQDFEGFSVYKGDAWIEKVCRIGRNPLFDPEVIVRTSLYAEIGAYNPALPHTSDMEMWLRCAARMDVGEVLGAEQAFYRSHINQLSRAFWSGRLGDLEGRRRAFDEFFSEDGSLLANAENLQRESQRALSRDAYRLASRAYDHGETADVSVDDLVEFARECDPSSASSMAAAGLRFRRRLGTTLSRPLRLLELRSIYEAIAMRLSWRARQVRTLRSGASWPLQPELSAEPAK